MVDPVVQEMREALRQNTHVTRRELAAVQAEIQGALEEKTLAMDEMKTVMVAHMEASVALMTKFDAQSYALAAIAGVALSQPGASAESVFNSVVNAPWYAPINDQVEPILRLFFGVRPALKVVCPTE